jgi:hypothetical protein
VNEDSLDTTRPYLVRLPQGKSISVFFYDGAVSRAVAFERLLGSGENFWTRLTGLLSHGLRNIATDGESYGHHFQFGEMALAYVIGQARESRDGASLTNYAAYLAEHPATDEALIHENTSWSCVHGVERWKTHCGCSDGGHPDWIQDWRRPLRRCLNYLKYYVDEQYFKKGEGLFRDSGKALQEYGLVLCKEQELTAFLDRHCQPGLEPAQRTDACRLLLMQRQALASFSSCAWFFDDIARIEPLNGLTAARRALDLLAATGGPDVEPGFVRVLAEAQSNMREDLDGATLWERLVTSRRPSAQELAAYPRCFPAAEGGQEMAWPGVRLKLTIGPEGELLSSFWTQTLEEETMPLSGPQEFSPRSRHKAELAFRLAGENERELLQRSCLLARDMGPLLSDFDEGQIQPQELLAFQIPGLVWNWLFEEQELSLGMQDFLTAWFAANPGVRSLLEGLIEERGTKMSLSLPAEAHALVQVITRSRRLGLSIYWWELQNRVMALPNRGVHVELCQLLGLS